MFAFLFGFIVGGVTGAAIVLTLSPSYQYREGDEEKDARAKAAEIGEMVRATVKEAIEEGKHALLEAIEEGKLAAAKRTAELEELVKKHQGQREEKPQA